VLAQRVLIGDISDSSLYGRHGKNEVVCIFVIGLASICKFLAAVRCSNSSYTPCYDRCSKQKLITPFSVLSVVAASRS
jgi:hypothetical protein